MSTSVPQFGHACTQVSPGGADHTHRLTWEGQVQGSSSLVRRGRATSGCLAALLLKSGRNFLESGFLNLGPSPPPRRPALASWKRGILRAVPKLNPVGLPNWVLSRARCAGGEPVGRCRGDHARTHRAARRRRPPSRPFSGRRAGAPLALARAGAHPRGPRPAQPAARPSPPNPCARRTSSPGRSRPPSIPPLVAEAHRPANSARGRRSARASTRLPAWSRTRRPATPRHAGQRAAGALPDALGHRRRARPGIVHRLDKDTSGCLVVAKNDFAHRALSGQFAARTTARLTSPWCAACRVRRRDHRAAHRPPPCPPQDAWPSSRRRAAGRPARITACANFVPKPGQEVSRPRTPVAIPECPGGKTVASLVECRLHTGRTHQIRVHLKHLGYPILGDTLYGGPRDARARCSTPGRSGSCIPAPGCPWSSAPRCRRISSPSDSTRSTHEPIPRRPRFRPARTGPPPPGRI